jgi:hypothetical protein
MIGVSPTTALPPLRSAAVRGTFIGALVALRLALGTVEDHPSHLLARAMAHCDVKEFLSGSRALASQLMEQGLTGGPR